MSAVNGSIATKQRTAVGQWLYDNSASMLGVGWGLVGNLLNRWFGTGGNNNNANNVPAGVVYPYPAQPPASASEDYGKYIVWGVLGLVFFAVLFMGFSFVMRISDNRKR